MARERGIWAREIKEEAWCGVKDVLDLMRSVKIVFVSLVLLFWIKVFSVFCMRKGLRNNMILFDT